jgi:hypothetical protein
MDDSDQMVTDDPTTQDYTESSVYDYSEWSAHDYSDQSGSGISMQYPPSSNVSSEVNSAVASDSDLPQPSHKASKPVHQTGLLNFFSTIPADKAQAMWREKKRKNREKDDEERAEIMQQEKEWKTEKLQIQRENNKLSQRKRRKRIHEEEIRSGVRDKDGKRVQVRYFIIIKK